MRTEGQELEEDGWRCEAVIVWIGSNEGRGRRRAGGAKR